MTEFIPYFAGIITLIFWFWVRFGNYQKNEK